MKTKERLSNMKWSALISVLLTAFLVCSAIPAWAGDDIKDPKALVVAAQKTFQDFVADPDMTWFKNNYPKAKAVFIVPQLVKAGFVFGGSGGSGALLRNEKKYGTWSYPAFYSMGSVTFGLQIGGAVSEVILLVMTQKGMDKMLSSSFKLGADMDAAVGPVGAGTGIKGVTADIYIFSRSKGVFGGLTIEGAVIATRDKWNSAYYGREVSPADILVLHNVSNIQADSLRAALKKAAK